MPLFPYETLILDSPLPTDEALGRLTSATGKRRSRHISSPDYRFYGEVHIGAIRIERAASYRNSFIPRVRGRLQPHPSGTRLVATLSMHPVVTIFMILWLGGIAFIGSPIMLSALFERDLRALVGLVPVLMFVLGWALMSGAFTYESRRTKEELRKILGAEPSSLGYRSA